jgi:hypothetical protein
MLPPKQIGSPGSGGGGTGSCKVPKVGRNGASMEVLIALGVVMGAMALGLVLDRG